MTTGVTDLALMPDRPTRLAEPAPAKLNLALHVRQRREDGFHELESLFAFAGHGDLLEASTSPNGSLSLEIEGPFAAGLDAGPDNLALKAARALRAASGGGQGAVLRLTKNLPVASGIGGGSADAAAALRLLDRLWGLGLGTGRLLAIATQLGSDVPACLVGRTLVGTGRGEALDLRTLPGLAGTPALLVNPGVALSTGSVFRAWDGIDRGALDADSLDAVIARGRNDLQPPAIALVPEIGEVLSLLAAMPGVRLARMSGSGATCFALFDTNAGRDAAATRVESLHPGWWTLRTWIA